MALYAPLKNIALSSFEKNLDKYLQQASCGGVLRGKETRELSSSDGGYKLAPICLRLDRLLRAPSVIYRFSQG